MAQMIFCRSCRVQFAAELRGGSCPACGDELIHARIPSGHPGLSRPRQPHTSRAVWDHILKKDVCSYCSDTKSTTIDHILPKALGGSKGSWTNRTGSCFRCNQDKAHTPLLFFMLQRCGEDLSHILDGEGRWILPEHERIVPEYTKIEEKTANDFGIDPRSFVFSQEKTSNRLQGELADAERAADYAKIAEEVALAVPA